MKKETKKSLIEKLVGGDIEAAYAQGLNNRTIEELERMVSEKYPPLAFTSVNYGSHSCVSD